MYTLTALCNIWGERFSPLAAESSTGLVFSQRNEPFEVGKGGRYANKPIPYGAATVDASSPTGTSSNLDSLLEIIEPQISSLRLLGAEEIVLHCDVFHNGQCNFEFSKSQLDRIARLKLPLTISCYRDDKRFPES
jgi:hypothetical protein